MVSSVVQSWRAAPTRLVVVLTAAISSALVATALHPADGADPTATVLQDASLELHGQVVAVVLGVDALGRRDVVFVAAATGPGEDLPDLYRMGAIVSPGGHPVRLEKPHNLTRSADVSETILASDSSRVVVATTERQHCDGYGKCAGCDGFVVLDIAGEPERLVSDWDELERAKNAVSNLQTTGSWRGLGRHRLQLEVAADDCRASTGTGGIVLQADARTWSLPADLDDADLDGLTIDPPSKGRRGHLAWMVDTVRDLPFVGPTKMALLEHWALSWADELRIAEAAIAAPSPDTVDPGLAATTGLTPMPAPIVHGDGLAAVGEAAVNPHWPPAAARPIVEDPVEGEGTWYPMTNLVKPAFDGRPYFFQSWLRPDPRRPFARVSVTAWDPARVELGVVAGTKEPEPTTSERGTGQIPREPGLLPRVVAAFNGGFQTKHGRWGMVVQDRTLVPPAGNAATIAVDARGRLRLGTWPATGPPASRKQLAPGLARPAAIVSLRQNLEPLVAEGKVNPSGRKKWGSTAGKHVDATHTTRTGVCLLEGEVPAYFFGTSVSAESLGAAMVAYGCSYGVHLDMNSGHSGFEFYNVKDEAGEDFEARRMIDKMWHMNFPRYIGKDFRDFFYLHLRESPQERLGRSGVEFGPPAVGARETCGSWCSSPRVLTAQVAGVAIVRLPRQDVAVDELGTTSGDLKQLAPDDVTVVLALNQDTSAPRVPLTEDGGVTVAGCRLGKTTSTCELPRDEPAAILRACGDDLFIGWGRPERWKNVAAKLFDGRGDCEPDTIIVAARGVHLQFRARDGATVLSPGGQHDGPALGFVLGDPVSWAGPLEIAGP